jgi:uncharacterized membrane protein YfcA
LEPFGPIGVGIGLGLLSGLFGLGGSSLATPLLRLLFHTPPLLALATPLPVTLLSAIGALMGYRSSGMVEGRHIWPIAVVGAPASALGAFASRYVGGHLLMVLTGALVMYLGFHVLVFRDAERLRPTVPTAWRSAVIGGAVGLVSGLLANGGGVFLVPALVMVQGMPMKAAVATSLAVIVAIAIPGTAVHVMLGHVDLRLAAELAAGMLPSAYVGSKLALRFINRTLERMYGVVLLLFGIYFLLSELLGVPNA